MQGMIPEEYGINPNVDCGLNENRYISLVTASQTLEETGYREGKDFTKKSLYMQGLKDYFIGNLQKYESEVMGVESNYSPAIVSFRIKNKDNATIVQELQEKGVFCSYISESDNIRVSFDITNTQRDVDMYFQRLNLK